MLATKAHAAMSDDDPNASGNSRRWIIRECEHSLRRLGTDYIDLYQIHRPDPTADVDETLSALTDLIRAGKIRYAGSSTFPPSQIVEAQWTAERRGRERFVCEQPPYSILVRGIEAEVLPVCQQYGMGVIPWSPLAGGWLTGRYRKGAEIPVSRRAQRIPQRFDLSLPGNQAKLEAAEQLAVLARGDRGVADPPGAGLRDPASGGDLGDHRAAHDGAAGEPARRRGRHAGRRPCWTGSTRSCRPART